MKQNYSFKTRGLKLRLLIETRALSTSDKVSGEKLGEV